MEDLNRLIRLNLYLEHTAKDASTKARLLKARKELQLARLRLKKHTLDFTTKGSH